MINLTGKVALITGATSGIGRATAVLFNQLGATVIITGKTSDRLKALAVELSQTGNSDAFPIVADICKEVDVQNLVDTALIKYKRIDILVNNAGVIEPGSIESTTLDSWDRVMNVNLRAIFHLTSLLVPSLIATKGVVINVSSGNNIHSFPGILSFNVSKAGLDEFTRCAALELAGKGVRVNAVRPGVVITELHKHTGMDDTAYAAFLQRSRSTHSMGRIGESQEVAKAIAFLASDSAVFITGATIPVDGGRCAN